MKFMVDFIARLLIMSVAVAISSYVLAGVIIDGFFTAMVVAGVLTLLNNFVKPLIVILTLPVTVLTLGIFLLIINAFIIIIADVLVPGFEVRGFWWALLFSFVLSLVMTLFEKLTDINRRHND
jgi:putative membrane protein